MGLIDDIDRLSRDRQLAQARGEKAEVIRLTREIESLYDQKRRRQALEDYGSTDEIVRRARIEVELGRIMADNGK